MTTELPVRAARAASRRRRGAAAAAVLSLAVVTGSAAPSGAAPKKPALEVYFLLDGTADMAAGADAVRAAVDGISARLARRTALRHGYGIFRDVDTTSLWLVSLYQRVSPVRASGGTMTRTHFYQGGGDSPEGHTFGLDAALGVEHPPWTVGPEPAGFTPSARKVIVLVTSSRPKQGVPYPGVADTVARLRSAGVGVATLLVSRGDQAPDVRQALDEISGGTGATARSAVDCDGDRRVDLARGAPLVCGVLTAGAPRRSFAGFADAIAARYAR